MSKQVEALDMQEVLAKVDPVLEKHGYDDGMLVGILQDVQAQFNYLPREALIAVSQRLGIALSRVFSVATFFKAFSLTPRGRHQLQVCMGTACHVRGAARILEKFETQIGIKAGETSEDMKYTLETVGCVGACALGPLAVLDNEFEGHLTVDKLSLFWSV